MAMIGIRLLCALVLGVGTLAAKEVYVSVDGSDDAEGTRSAPMGSLQKAAKRVGPGDIVYLLGGRYPEPMEVAGLRGEEGNPVTIAAAPGELVIFDGTDVLPDAWQEVRPDSPEGKLIQPAQWKRLKGKIFAQDLDQPIHALIYDDRLMSDARWPDSRWSDPWRLDRYMVLRRASEKSTKGKLHDSLPTDNTLEESETWIHYDRSKLKHRDETLGDTGVSFQDAVVVMSHTWGSWGTRVTGHEAGGDFFEYDTTFAGSGSIRREAVGFLNNRIGWKNAARNFKRSSHGGIHFFFMGLPALDIEEEWWYHDATKTLYFVAPGGKKPGPGTVRGKRRDFLLTARDCKHLRVKALRFVGAAAMLDGCENSRLEGCSFRVGSYHKFSVGNFDMPVTTKISNRRVSKDGDKSFGNALVNCRFTFCDGNAFEGRSTGLTIDNVLIRQTQQTTLGLDSRSMSIDRPALVRRVTIEDVGASVGIKGGGIDSIYELNNISRFGGLQYDGASLQMGGRQKFVYRYNWSHDHPKRSYRFDAGSFPDFANAFGEMSYNVAWNTPGGFAIKGDDHLIHNNVLIGGAFELFNMKRWASKNERTLVANNVVREMLGGSYDWDKPVVKKSTEKGTPETSDTFWLKETVVSEKKPGPGKKKAGFDDANRSGPRQSVVLAIRKNNFMDDPAAVLRDPANLDFRPREGSELIDAGHRITKADVPWKKVPITGSESSQGKAPDIGAYESGSDHYWIPGFKFPHASTPVPPDGSTAAKPDCDLMWLGGYKAQRHHVYTGGSEAEVAGANLGGGTYQGVFESEQNIHSFQGSLGPGETIFWRVDAERDGRVIKGKVWKFTVGQ